MSDSTHRKYRKYWESQSTSDILGNYRLSGYSEGDRDAMREILLERHVEIPEPEAQDPNPKGPLSPAKSDGSQIAAFTITGALVGCLAGYLLGTPPSLPFEVVITRGADLKGFDTLMRPAAEAAFNWMLAGGALGLFAGFGLGSLLDNRSPHASKETSLPCPDCGAAVPSGMEFCGKCGKSVSPEVCVKCGKPVPADQSFCGGCGTRVRS